MFKNRVIECSQQRFKTKRRQVISVGAPTEVFIFLTRGDSRSLRGTVGTDGEPHISSVIQKKPIENWVFKNFRSYGQSLNVQILRRQNHIDQFDREHRKMYKCTNVQMHECTNENGKQNRNKGSNREKGMKKNPLLYLKQ